MRDWLRTFTLLFWRNWITMLGASVTTAAAFLFVGFIILGVLGIANTPYIGIITFMVLPGVFLLGLVIIPLGVWWEYRKRVKRAAHGEVEPPPRYPRIDLNNPRIRKGFFIILFLTGVNMFIISGATYEGVHYMESTEFCGMVCHSVMEPEHTAYMNSPHASVDCVECHIGPGAPWFVRSKLSGTRQVFAVMLNTYEKPIKTPVANLRPSRDTCEQCHWPEKFTGDRVRVKTNYAEDETNTPMKTVMILHIGGGASRSHGIHSWHIDPSKETRYWTQDEKLQEIGIVRVNNDDGTTQTYVADGLETDVEQIPEDEWHVMDCIDCHNRPTHVYHLPGPALDLAMSEGDIDPTLPYIKKVGLEALTGIENEEGDLDRMESHIRDFYETEYPDVYAAEKEKIDAAIAEIKAIYGRNVFPKMEVTWATYPNNIGHPNDQSDFQGCFRCHDDMHSSDEGDMISGDCTICHSVLAMQEEEPAILDELGIE